MKQHTKILIALILGIIFGLVFKEHSSYLKIFGDLFISLIKLIIVPLVFFSVTNAIITLKGDSNLGKIAINTILLYLLTTVIAITLGLTLAIMLNPASNIADATLLKFDAYNVDQAASNNNILDIVLNIIPSNIFVAFSSGNMIQIIFLSIVIALGINALKDKSKTIKKFIAEGNDLTYYFMDFIIKIMPYAVFALIASVVGTQDIAILHSLLKFVLCVVFALLIHLYIIYPILIYSLTGLNPIYFFKKIIEAQLFAFSSSSSSATLPTTIRVANQNLGISKATTNMVLPLGATINMDGGAIYLGMSTVFIAGLFGIDLSIVDYISIILNCLLISVGTAGIPGASIVLMSAIFMTVGLPVEAIGIIIGVDRVLDMCRTSVNVTGDLVVSTIIDKKTKTLDSDKYYK